MSLLKDEVILPTRFFLAPINTGFSENGVPTSRLFQFHKERAGHGIGVAYVGNVAISSDCKTNDGTAIIESSHLSVWKELSQCIQAQGSIPAIQLACRAAPLKSRKNWITSDRAEYIQATSSFIKSLSSEQIRATCEDFVRAAVLADQAGFRVVQIHAAHGYLLSLLLNRKLNTRSDSFGDGTYALALIAEGIAKQAPGIKLDVRISLFDGLEDSGIELSYRRSQIEHIVRLGYWMLSLSAGLYDVDRRPIYPSGPHGFPPYLEHAISLGSKFPSVLWNVAGRLVALSRLDAEVRGNVSFSIGRPLIADPCFVEKSLAGKDDEIVACVLSGRCHYFSRGKPHIECGVNRNV